MMKKENSKSKQDEVSVEDLQAELLRLQRQFRLLEDDRRSYREESKHTLQKQRDSISNLNVEHEDLAKDYKLAASIKNQSADAENTEILRNLSREEDTVFASMTKVNEENKILDKKIKGLMNNIEMVRKDMGGCKESERRCIDMIKLNRVMENRLNDSNVKFNTALAENSEMRQEIEHINKQRNHFQDLHKKLTKVFEAGKEEKDCLIESSTTQFNSRDEAQHRMQSLRERSERDMTQFNSELKDILRIIDHDKKLQEFMNTKMEERNEMYEAAIQGRLEKKLLNHVKALQVEVEHYESIFKELNEVSGFENIDEMVNSFISVEDKNFASFNFVKDQNQRMQQNEAAIENFKKQIQSMGKEEIHVAKHHNDILKTLKLQEVKLDKDMESFTSQVSEDDKKLDKIRSNVDKIFSKARCNRSVMNELLGGSKIKNDNLLSYLGLIEQKVSELTQARQVITLKNGGEMTEHTEVHKHHLSFATVGRIARYLVCPPAINTDLHEVSTPVEDVRPMSQHETKLMATQLANDDKESRKSAGTDRKSVV